MAFQPRPYGRGTTLASESARCVPDVSGPWGYIVNHSTPTDTSSSNATWEGSYAIIFTNIFNGVGTQIVLPIGGTSLACPTFAGIVALINQNRGSNGSIGWLNPWLYEIGENYDMYTGASGGGSGNGLQLVGSAFQDISANFANLLSPTLPSVNSDGSYLTFSNANNTYDAGAGYDLCTGLGTPNVANLGALLRDPVYVVEPQSMTVATGGSCVFSAFAQISPSEIAAATYQWYYKPNGGSWSELSTSTNPYAQSPQLLVTNLTTANSGDQYYCVDTAAAASGGTAAFSITTQTATVTVVNTSTPGRMIDASARGFVSTGSSGWTGGFYLELVPKS